MANKGLITFIVLCFASASLAAEGAEEARTILGSPAKETKADERLFFSDGTQVTVSTDALAIGILLLGILALLLVVLPGLLGGGDTGTAGAYSAPSASTYAVDPYASRSASSVSNVLETIGQAAKKYANKYL